SLFRETRSLPEWVAWRTANVWLGWPRSLGYDIEMVKFRAVCGMASVFGPTHGLKCNSEWLHEFQNPARHLRRSESRGARVFSQSLASTRCISRSRDGSHGRSRAAGGFCNVRTTRENSQ